MNEPYERWYEYIKDDASDKTVRVEVEDWNFRYIIAWRPILPDKKIGAWYIKWSSS